MQLNVSEICTLSVSGDVIRPVRPEPEAIGRKTDAGIAAHSTYSAWAAFAAGFAAAEFVRCGFLRTLLQSTSLELVE